MNIFRRSAIRDRTVLIIIALATVQAMIIGGVIVVVWHFIAKFW